jgi:hypothetical protein
MYVHVIWKKYHIIRHVLYGRIIKYLIWKKFNTCVVYIRKYNTWIRRGRDRMIVGFTTTYAISAYYH